MKREVLIAFLLYVLSIPSLHGESAIYAGMNNASNEKLLGLCLGGELWAFLGLELDVFKSTKAEGPLGASANFTLTIPLSLIPPLEKAKFIQPYILSGIGTYTEKLDLKESDLLEQFQKYKSYGVGVHIMFISKAGVRLDYRIIKLANSKWSRSSIGISF